MKFDQRNISFILTKTFFRSDLFEIFIVIGILFKKPHFRAFLNNESKMAATKITVGGQTIYQNVDINWLNNFLGYFLSILIS